MGLPEIDTSTEDGRTLLRTLEILQYERQRPRSTLGMLYDVVRYNQQLLDQNKVYIRSLSIVGLCIPDNSILFTYSDGNVALFPYVVDTYLNAKLAEHHTNSVNLPDSELRT